MWIGICMLILLVGCTSSFKDCTFECTRLKSGEYCEGLGGCVITRDGCCLHEHPDREIFREDCYQECRGAD